MVGRVDPKLIPPAPDLLFETDLWNQGVRYVAGIDEAGRGSLAGPVAAAALILPPDPGLMQSLAGVRDSKKLTATSREYWADCLKDLASAHGIGFATNQEIDTIGIVPATRLAAQRALDRLSISPQHLLLDYLELPDVMLPQISLVKGDERCLSIAGASILAKTARDELMRQLEDQYPGYGFSSNKGYATLQHREALAELGLSPVHRSSFKVKEIGSIR